MSKQRLESGNCTVQKPMEVFQCIVCDVQFERKNLEGHISSDHLDYYPYSCGHCGHFMPTEEHVVFHAEKKQHLPLKIRENLNKTKEQKLQEVLQRCVSVSVDSSTASAAVSQQKQNLEMDQQNAAPVLQETSTPVLQQNSTPVLQQNSTPVLQQNSTPELQQNSTPVLLKQNSTPEFQQTSTPVLQQNSTPELQQNSTPVLQQNSATVLQQNSATVLQQNATPVLQQNLEPEADEEEIEFVDPLGRDTDSFKDMDSWDEMPVIGEQRAEAASITAARNLRAIHRNSPPKRIPVKVVKVPAQKPAVPQLKPPVKPEPVKEDLQAELPKLDLKTEISNPLQMEQVPNSVPNPEVELPTSLLQPEMPKPVQEPEELPKPVHTDQQELISKPVQETEIPEPIVQAEHPKPITQELQQSVIQAASSIPEKVEEILKPALDSETPILGKDPDMQKTQGSDEVMEAEPKAEEKPPVAVLESLQVEPEPKMESNPAAEQLMEPLEPTVPEKVSSEADEVILEEADPEPLFDPHTPLLEKPLDSILTRVSSDSESPLSIPLQVSETPTPPPLQPLQPPKNPITEFLDHGLPTFINLNQDPPPAPKVSIPVQQQAKTPIVPVAKLKRGIEQIANQLAASSQHHPPKVPKVTERYTVIHRPIIAPAPVQKPVVSEKPKVSISPHWQRSHCKVCSQYVPVSEIMQHVEKHVDTRPKFGCIYCAFKGRTPNSVRVHITWKHANCCARAGAGVKDISEEGDTAEEMLAMCFPNFTPAEVEKYCSGIPISLDDDPIQNLPVFKTSSHSSSSSSSGTATRLPANTMISPAPKVSAVPASVADLGSKFQGSTISRTATMPSGRVYRYMHCTVCGAEVIDALASSHIYQTHINRRDAIQCGYCEYGVPYAIAEVKRHVQAKHPYQPQRIVDRRPEMQEEYMAWRLRCFPDIGTRQPQKTVESSLIHNNNNKIGNSSNSRPTMVVEESASDKVLLDILKRPPMQINTSREQTLNAHTGTPVSAHQKYWSQAHVRNSKKSKCSKCSEEITHLWANRHIWRHLEEERMSRYKCKAPGCEYQTYLMRSLDTHCNYHGKGLTAEMVGFEDRADKLRDAWVNCWKECFGDEEIPMNSDSPPQSVMGGFFSSSSYDDCQVAPSDAALNLLMVAAHGQDQVNFTLQKASTTSSSSRDSPIQCSSSSSCASQLASFAKQSSITPRGVRLPVIRSSIVDEMNSSIQEEAWCQKCCCSVARKEVEDHIWFAHLGGVLPYRCGRCQRSFMSEQLVRDHWELEHYISPSAGFNNLSMEITKNAHARVRFENEILECFPEIV